MRKHKNGVNCFELPIIFNCYFNCRQHTKSYLKVSLLNRHALIFSCSNRIVYDWLLILLGGAFVLGTTHIFYVGSLLWHDKLSLATDGSLYVTANQLHRQARFNKEGRDLRRKPYTLFRINVDARFVPACFTDIDCLLVWCCY